MTRGRTSSLVLGRLILAPPICQRRRAHLKALVPHLALLQNGRIFEQKTNSYTAEHGRTNGPVGSNVTHEGNLKCPLELFD